MANDAKKTMLEQLGVTITRESNRAEQLGTATEAFPVVNMFARETTMSNSLRIFIDGEVPYADEDGAIGLTREIAVSGALNGLAASCGATGNDRLPFEVSDFISANNQVEGIKVKVTVTHNKVNGIDRILHNVAISGDKAMQFGKVLKETRAARLAEYNQYPELFSTKANVPQL